MITRTLITTLLVAALPAQQDSKKTEPAKDAPKTMETGRMPDDALTAKDQAVVAIDKFIKESVPANKGTGWKTSLPKPPMLTFSKACDYQWRMDTNKGSIVVKLMPGVAPMHCSSTIYLARLGFYDNVKFHRVITGFMAQGGCPIGRGTGNPGYSYEGEFDPAVKHDRPGLLSMANAGPGTDGSQFFLTFVPTPHLNGKHTIFGEVVSGMEVVRELEKAGSPGGPPRENLEITRSWIQVLPAEGAAKDDKGKKDESPKKQPPAK